MLYNKLKPEIKRELYRNSNKYAISIKGILNKLKTTRYYNSLTVGDIKQIRAFGGVTSTDILFAETLFNSKI
mgnify:FL=1